MYAMLVHAKQRLSQPDFQQLFQSKSSVEVRTHSVNKRSYELATVVYRIDEDPERLLASWLRCQINEGIGYHLRVCIIRYNVQSALLSLLGEPPHRPFLILLRHSRHTRLSRIFEMTRAFCEHSRRHDGRLNAPRRQLARVRLAKLSIAAFAAK